MALTTDWQRCSLGNKLMCYTKVTGDGSATTINVPMSRIEAAWIALYADSGTVESSSLTISWSGQVVTYSGAVSSSKVHQLFVIGTD